MNKLVLCALTAALVVAAAPASVHSAPRRGSGPAGSASMRFGIDMGSLDRAHAKKLDFAFGVFWEGAWTQKYGWQNAETQLRAAKRHNVTPVINWWYWGDDIRPGCLQEGCYDARQGVQKNKATWYRMSDELSQVIARTLGEREAYVVLETEFNKGGIETSEAFDGHLADVIGILHRRGNVKVVLGFGNWGREHWRRFDRAIAAADLLGTQLLRSSARDQKVYLSAVDTLVDGARYVQREFAKPSMIVDLALSSYPSSSYEARQAQVLADLQARMPELAAAGVRGIMYRMITDDPKFDTSNYHGVAERHWGLLRADGSEKPAFAVFANIVRGQSPGRAAAVATGGTR